MKFPVVFLFFLALLGWQAASQVATWNSDSPHITGGRHYWEWVTACSEWAQKAQDRYICTNDGKIQCKSGWKWNMCKGAMCAYLETSSTFCSEPVCRDGCDKNNGYCEVPNTCKCKIGFSGDNCTELLSLPGCKNGKANSTDLLCVCDAGWKGAHCNIPAHCRAGCSSEHGYCNDPKECICKLGWQGENCDECVPYPGCDKDNGYCVDPWECRCRSDNYSGTFCNETKNTTTVSFEIATLVSTDIDSTISVSSTTLSPETNTTVS